MKRSATIRGLLLIDLGIFLGTVVFLPERGVWSSSGPLSGFINSRARWDIAWGVLAAALILSAGVYALIGATGTFDRNSEKTQDPDSDENRFPDRVAGTQQH